MGIVGTAVAAATGFQLTRLSVEGARYTVVLNDGGVELRRYAPRVVAEVDVDGPAEGAESRGFRVLADYIFGRNAGAARVAMTTPVETRAGARIAMTTPVTQTGDADRMTMAFTMPSEHSLASLPAPIDPRVRLREVGPELVAAVRFSGRADRADVEARMPALAARLAALGYAPSGAPSLAQYDPPWVLGPLRRNELLVPVRPR